MLRGQIWRRLRAYMARVAMTLFVGCLLYEMGMLVMMLLG